MYVCVCVCEYNQHQQSCTRTYLEEPADGLLVITPHGNHILIEPEEWPVFLIAGFDIGQDTKVLKEKTSSAL